MPEAAVWLRDQACQHYPESVFVTKYCGFVRTGARVPVGDRPRCRYFEIDTAAVITSGMSTGPL